MNVSPGAELRSPKSLEDPGGEGLNVRLDASVWKHASFCASAWAFSPQEQDSCFEMPQRSARGQKQKWLPNPCRLG
eukprot:CAMPEP_0174368072 /NCGR_PEP_ID=MMETSP0811_2-20130205/87702_1 /TAXON_ID=73025 ORGANISM="Eutreptiella gymnastica-like, Strain CCMP1594" /NCGR_SAMPLE_ID=MMETSP0811_2 /ASSEMBLY_ACC=CAM_ASM_000667 /LENGTH=75 /DNA_ID=CAMNT_0015511251 /DNA_START=237 /DNA_END=461 /DNA_ORIENTATION=-